MKKIDKNSEAKRKKLKRIGLPCLIIGIILFLIALLDFISVFDGGGSPQLFFLFFLAIPLIFVGSCCLLYANMGKIMRYTASQTAPVQKDVVNYLLDETKENIANVSNTIKGTKKVCSYCLTENDYDAQFCKSCGREMNKKCLYCNEVNDSDAKYCDKCGKELE